MKIVIDRTGPYNSDAGLLQFSDWLWPAVAAENPGIDVHVLRKKGSEPVPPAGNYTEHLLPVTWLKWTAEKRKKDLLRMLAPGLCILPALGGFALRKPDRKNRWTSIGPGISFTGMADEKTFIRPAWDDAFRHPEWAALESTRTEYAGGNAYFFYSGTLLAVDALTRLLQAFSVFKKWQQSGMQLLLAGNEDVEPAVLQEKLSTYKYRNDVKILTNPPEKQCLSLLAASYAVLYPLNNGPVPFALAMALQFDKAVVAVDNPVNRLLSPCSAWVNDADGSAGFAKEMQRLYKDERYMQGLLAQNKMAAPGLNRSSMIAQIARLLYAVNELKG